MKITKVKSEEHWGKGVLCQCNHPDPRLCHECEESTGVCYCKCHTTAQTQVRQLKLIKVGVFPPSSDSHVYMAYTRWYNPTWPRCCEHQIEALNGTEAKKLAIREHKQRCELRSGG